MIKNITRLRTSNPHSRQSLLDDVSNRDAYTLTSALLRANPTWAIDSLVKYAMMQYKDYGISYKIISECMYDYVMERN